MLIIFRPIYTSDTLLLEDNQFPDICLTCPTPKYYWGGVCVGVGGVGLLL